MNFSKRSERMRYNVQQKAYLRALGDFIVAEKALEAEEREYIKEHSLKNPDGSTPLCIGRFDCGDKAFEAHCANFSARSSLERLNRQLYCSQKALIKAENELILFAFSLMPEGEDKNLLARGVKTLTNVRREVIELAMALDATMVYEEKTERAS